jgi:hypothetical protein
MPGAVIHRGPSQLDGEPIVVVAIWAATRSSANRKTGDMLQTYIMRSDIDPLTANKYGEDYSICGDCDLRGTPTLDPDKKQAEDRPCYVVLGKGPLQVWKGLQRNAYPDKTKPNERRDLGRGRMVRIGTYGDGAAVDRQVWDDLLYDALGHNAYSHNGGDPRIYMQSVESLDAARSAWAQGFRTFRLVRDVSDIVRSNEILCPSSRGVQCVDCRLCGGTSVRAKSIAIEVHGSGAKHF